MTDLLPHIVLITGTFILAGLVKGVTGLGLPTVSMGLLGLAMRGEKDVHSGRVAEIYPRQVNHQAGRATVNQRPIQFTLQPGNCVQIDLALDRHDDVFPLLPACDL